MSSCFDAEQARRYGRDRPDWTDLSGEVPCPGDGVYQTEPHVMGEGIVCRRCRLA